jgi:hypothetical protein
VVTFGGSFEVTTQEWSADPAHVTYANLMDPGGGAFANAIPEPETYALMLAGPGALSIKRRRPPPAAGSPRPDSSAPRR